jgi:hypothetical protein
MGGLKQQMFPISGRYFLQQQLGHLCDGIDLVALGLIGPFCVIKQNGPIEPHTNLLSSFAPFFVVVTVHELGIGF